MGKKTKDSIKISQDTQIDLPTSRTLFSVDKNDWDRIKRLINKIDTSSNKWENFGWFMFATFFAFLIAGLTTSLNYRVGFFVASIFSLIIVIIVFCVVYKISRSKNDSKKEVIIEMDKMEK